MTPEPLPVLVSIRTTPGLTRSTIAARSATGVGVGVTVGVRVGVGVGSGVGVGRGAGVAVGMAAMVACSRASIVASRLGVGAGSASFIAALTVAGISGVGPGDAVAQAANRRKAAMDAMKKRIKLLLAP